MCYESLPWVYDMSKNHKGVQHERVALIMANLSAKIVRVLAGRLCKCRPATVIISGQVTKLILESWYSSMEDFQGYEVFDLMSGEMIYSSLDQNGIACNENAIMVNTQQPCIEPRVKGSRFVVVRKIQVYPERGGDCGFEESVTIYEVRLMGRR